MSFKDLVYEFRRITVLRNNKNVIQKCYVPLPLPWRGDLLFFFVADSVGVGVSVRVGVSRGVPFVCTLAPDWIDGFFPIRYITELRKRADQILVTLTPISRSQGISSWRYRGSLTKLVPILCLDMNKNCLDYSVIN